jgi:Family of unknown function (DUF6325)
MGPVEYMITTFPTTTVDPALAQAIQDLVDNGTIAVLDFLLVAKDMDGSIAAVEADEESEFASFAIIDGEIGTLISEADIDYVGSGLMPGTCALVLVCEDRWASPLADLLRDSGGLLYEGARVPTDVVDAAMAELEFVG